MVTQSNPENQQQPEAEPVWIDLDNYVEAIVELDNIRVENYDDPDVLDFRWRLQAQKANWVQCLEIALILIILAPQRKLGWLRYAQSLHKLNHTEVARDTLISAMEMFESNVTFPFYIACCACQLGDKEEAMSWLGLAFVKARLPERMQRLKSKALEEPDLGPIRNDIDRIVG